MSILPNNEENVSSTPYQQLSECTSRLWKMRSFLYVLNSAVLYDQEKLLDTSYEMLYNDLLDRVLKDLLDILDAMEEVQRAINPDLQHLRSNR
ncbi:MAG: hypothetical protein SW833_17440 [Cyanobacteriota bacterium]|nr:hypothetical protein [Cyanobacteriota bacterium]